MVTLSKNPLVQQSLEESRRDRNYSTLQYLALRAFKNTEEFMIYIRLIGQTDQRFSLFWRLWQQNKRHQSIQRGRSYMQLSLDTVARQAGLDALDVKIELVRFCHQINADVAAIIADIAHPEIVKRNIKEALKPSGVKDRELHFWRRGELPGKGGVSVNVNATAIAGAKGEGTPLPDFEEAAIEGSKTVRNAEPEGE